jgi:hypothetical protein
MERKRERVAPRSGSAFFRGDAAAHEALDLGGEPEIGGTEARQCPIKIDEAGDRPANS